MLVTGLWQQTGCRQEVAVCCMQISFCILTVCFRRLGWISSTPGDLVMLILSIPSIISSAVMQDRATQCVSSLRCANQRWTLLSGSFPLKRPPFSRWWEWGANTLLSHTPTPCLLKKYFLCPRSEGRNRSAAISVYPFCCEFTQPAAFLLPLPQRLQEPSEMLLDAAAGSWPQPLRHASVGCCTSPVPAAQTDWAAGYWYSAVQSSAPRIKRSCYVNSGDLLCRAEDAFV